MRVLMDILRRTWLVTMLFVVVTSAIWWQWLGWESAREHLFTTLCLSPLIWWAGIGRKQPPHLLRGLAVGALTGVLTQIVPHLRFIWPLLSHAGKGDGEDQMVGIVSAVFYLIICVGGLIVGAVLGMIATAIDRQVQQRTTGAAASVLS